MTKAQSRVEARKMFKLIKGDIIKGWHIHHIDGNPFNNEIDNLYHCSSEEHSRIHKVQGDWFYGLTEVAGKSGKDHPMYGKSLTQEWKDKISASLTGRKHTDESITKMSEVKKGIKKTPEHIEKVAAAQRGKKLTQETKDKIAATLRRKK